MSAMFFKNSDSRLCKILPVFLVILAFLLTSCEKKELRTLEFSVHHTVEIPVDYVTVLVVISEWGTDASRVEKSGYDNLARVTHLLRTNGISEEHLTIEAGQVTMSPYRTEFPYEYRAAITFEFHDLEQLDSARGAIIEAGASSFLISGYGNTNENNLMEEAYRNALQDARDRADSILAGQKVRSGKILRLQESYSGNIRHDHQRSLVATNTPEDSSFGSRPSLFQKTHYSKNLHFQITFELIDL